MKIGNKYQLKHKILIKESSLLNCQIKEKLDNKPIKTQSRFHQQRRTLRPQSQRESKEINFDINLDDVDYNMTIEKIIIQLPEFIIYKIEGITWYYVNDQQLIQQEDGKYAAQYQNEQGELQSIHVNIIDKWVIKITCISNDYCYTGMLTEQEINLNQQFMTIDDVFDELFYDFLNLEYLDKENGSMNLQNNDSNMVVKQKLQMPIGNNQNVTEYLQWKLVRTKNELKLNQITQDYFQSDTVKLKEENFQFCLDQVDYQLKVEKLNCRLPELLQFQDIDGTMWYYVNDQQLVYQEDGKYMSRYYNNNGQEATINQQITDQFVIKITCHYDIYYYTGMITEQEITQNLSFMTIDDVFDSLIDDLNNPENINKENQSINLIKNNQSMELQQRYQIAKGKKQFTTILKWNLLQYENYGNDQMQKKNGIQ